MRINRYLVFDMNLKVKQDLQEFVLSFELSNDLSNKKFLITGATGLIGSILVHCLLALKRNISIIAPVRSTMKVKEIFDTEEISFITFIECDIATFNYDMVGVVDYIVHCAAPTSSKYFIEHPVDTFQIIYKGTEALLEYAKNKQVNGFVYLSSLEVYGTISDGSIQITEDVQGYLNPMAVRSCYPMAKRAAENLCCVYAAQYGVNVKIARLTQTTGAGISENDNRIIAQFCRLAAKGENIILHTKGEAARPYCYTIDCVSAILYILLKGAAGEAYNVANEGTYVSAKGLAEILREKFNPDIKVLFDLKDNMGYALETKLRLNVDKLKALGWTSQHDLMGILKRMIDFLK